MPRSRSDARSRLVSAARHRFAVDGPLVPTLDEVRREADVSVGALYHHFADKQSLVAAVYAELMGEYQRGFIDTLARNDTAREGICAVVAYHLRWIAEHRIEARLLLGDRIDSPQLQELNRRFFDAVQAWWKPHSTYGVLRPMNLGVTAALWLGPAQEYSRYWITGSQTRVPPAIVKTLSEAAWATLRIDDGGTA
ncbi:TetR family transcriptional regulator [Mycolicibacterium conceptionense]|uniref:TetR family transcriptional regulator n=1 Tax=Mycolicibacterium conceptionense TaxID=451644 RepID=A0A1A0PWH2_9MYCO|nr:TetR family transcriptional regulator [Mycolicibacterium conceptionense]OBF07398.1 TetR family transcriptional regulator [Mycolicibacterium conceptionense]OBF28143.1 TetR family transcriptional regulator [Mycolicibacterium conceptionense]OBF38666.1 TetR family transcriptional regulator [Mycolicibacterium conceptionense]OBH92645.1 TetR family transcriptional regulator [Mycolicibacterium conceptionense]